MGCAMSKDQRVHSARVEKKIISPRSGPVQQLIVSEDQEDIINSFDFITDEIDYIQCPSGMVPIACVDHEAFCICTSNLILEDNRTTGIKLPVIAASIANLGRIVCLGHISMLSPDFFLIKDTTPFYHNLFVWLTSKKLLLCNVLLLNVAHAYKSELSNELRGLGFTCENGDFSNDFNRYRLIVITTDLCPTDEETSKLREFSKHGGSILCCYTPSDRDNLYFPINAFLSEYGLSYMNLALSSDNSVPVKVVMPYSYSEVRNKVFVNMINTLKSVLSSEPVKVNKLDDLVSEMRYVLTATNEKHTDVICMMIDYCWEFLKKSGYQNSKGQMDPNIIQSIVIILIIDLNSMLPISRQKVIPDCITFPGVGKSETKDYKMELSLQDQGLTSTGLWLPAGVISTVTLEDYEPGPNESIVVQIGIHTESMLLQKSTWRRWPQVVVSYPLKKGTTKVYSQFGGIVYIASRDIENKIHASFTFRGFSKHPRAIEGKPEKYEQTKDIDVPWAEIQCKSCVVTLPTTNYLEINDMSKVYNFFNSIIKWVTENCSYPINRKFRIAFDIQTLNLKPVASYPIFVPFDDVDDLMNQHKKPTVALYNLLATLATVCFTEDYFDNETEESLAQVVAAQILYKTYNGFDVETNNLYEKTKLFHVLWYIHRNVDETVIPTIISNSIQLSDTVFYDEEDRWVSFTTEMSKIAHLNFAPVFSTLKRMPKNISADVDQYPVFIYDEPQE